MNPANFIDAVVDGDGEKVHRFVAEALEQGEEAAIILTEGLTPGILKVGELFHTGEIFLPEMLRSAKAMNAGLSLLEPILSSTEAEPLGKVVLGTVKGDLHDIGKNIVGMLMRGVGFEVFDLGVDVSADRFIESISAQKAEIVAISALLSTTVPSMEDTVKAIKGSYVGDQVKILVGGAPVDQELAAKIGADSYGEDAPEAVKKAMALIG
ncbi:MAG: corrinoid protein [Desulfobacterales bacterium]|nr:corrinoid protein [Desulfobacterales bacterium]